MIITINELIRIILTGLSALATLTLGGVVFMKSRNPQIKTAFSLFTLGLASWQIVVLILITPVLTSIISSPISPGLTDVTRGIRLTYFPTILFLLSFVYLGYNYPTTHKPYRLLPHWILALFIGAVIPTRFFLIQVVVDSHGTVISHGNTGQRIVMIIFLYWFALGCFNFYQKYQIASYQEKLKIKYFILGMLLTITFVLFCDLILPVFNEFSLAAYGPIGANFVVASTAYAILKHRVMDIDLVIKKSTYFLLLFLAVTLPYLIISHLISAHFPVSGSAHIAFSALFWMLFILFIDAIKRTLLKLTDKIFFMADYDYNTALNAITRAIQAATDYHSLVCLLDTALYPVIKNTSTALLTPTDQADQLRFLPADPHRGERIISLPPDLLWQLSPTNKPCILYEEISLGQRHSPSVVDLSLRDLLDATQSRILVSGLFDHQLTTFIALGTKKSGQNFKEKDINLLTTVSAQVTLVVAKLQEIEEKSRIRMEKELQEKYAAQLASTNELLQLKNTQLAAAYEQIKNQEAALISQEKLAILGDITASVAHEISTPLLSLTLGLEKLISYDINLRQAMGAPQSKAKIMNNPAFQRSHNGFEKTAQLLEKALDQIRNQVTNMKSFIKFQKSSDTVNLNTELETILNIMNVKLLSEMAVSRDLAPDLPVLSGDGAMLNQALMALIKNAADFHKPGQRGHLRIRTHYDLQNLYLEIADDGIGISPENQHKLFKEKFTTKPGGTGLGLSIAQEIVNALGGEIAIDSEPGQGTQIILTFALSPKNQ